MSYTGKVIILCGIPGSGKSTYIKNNFVEPVICSADIYWEKLAEARGKTYKEVWNREGLGKAHEYSHDQFINALRNKNPLVIVDNTNLSHKARKFYIDEGKAHSYKVEIHTLPFDVDICAKRNVHGVDRDGIAAMMKNIDIDMGKIYDLSICTSGPYDVIREIYPEETGLRVENREHKTFAETIGDKSILEAERERIYRELLANPIPISTVFSQGSTKLEWNKATLRRIIGVQ